MNVLRPTALFLLLPRAAGADPLSIEGEATPWERLDRHLDAESQGRRGWILEGSTGLGGCTGELCREVLGAEPGVGLSAGFGYRFAPIFSLGVAIEHQWLRAEHAQSVLWDSIGVSGRFYFTRQGPFDPFAGFFAGPVAALAEGGRVDGSLAGTALGLELGAAFALSTRVAPFVFARYRSVFWTEACYFDGDRESCSETERVQARSRERLVTERDLPDLWSVGIGVRVTL